MTKFLQIHVGGDDKLWPGLNNTSCLLFYVLIGGCKVTMAGNYEFITIT